jgi:thiol-disulfide isomerase/thioredoxin
MRMRPWITLTFLPLLLTACGQAESPALQTEVVEDVGDPANGIAWFQGGVDEAFVHAAETGKPVYLYWGAEWCPPCHAIAATVFSKPEFIDRSKLFVPVYLDGDSPNAQAQGERFGVLGYPTMIVFSADGTELTRIRGGIDIQAYAGILDLTLNSASSASAVVAGVMAAGNELDAGDCRLLAYHSWSQDTEILADHAADDAFRRMFDACPENMRVERSMLYLAWLNSAIASLDEGAEVPEQQREEAVEWIAAILDDPALTRANILDVLLAGPGLVRELTAADSEDRRHLTTRFYAAYDRIATDESIYKRERIYTLAGRIRFERLENEEAQLSDGLVARIRDMTEWADTSTTDVYERQPIINALANVLNEAGMDDVAKPLLLAELDRSKQPYYFMAKLGGIEQRAGNYDAAIKWLETAYAATRGPATRFEWGYYYLQGLLEMRPDDTARIRDTAVGLVRELQESGGIYHRPKRQLARLDNLLREWGETRGAALADLRESVRSVCEQVPTGDDTCASFLGSV